MKKPCYNHLGIPIAVGDIITTYHKGYWRLVDIQRRYFTKDDISRYGYAGGTFAGKKVGDEYSPIFVYEQVMMENFKPVTRKSRKQCDAQYCRKVTKEIVKEMQTEFNVGCDRLAALL